MKMCFCWLLLLSPSAIAVTATVKQPTPLLAEPRADATELARLAAAAPVEVMSRSGGWYQVAPPQQTAGWLRLFSVQFVKGRYQPDNLPLQDLTGLVIKNQLQVTSSTGVRGLDKVAITDAAPNFDQLLQMQRLLQSAAQAQLFADQAMLKADLIVSLQEPNK